MQATKQLLRPGRAALPKIWDGFASVAPKMAEPVLRQLFLTPTRKAHGKPAAGGILGSVRCNGRRVLVRAAGQGPVVVLVHGWQGHMGQFRDLSASLVDSGYCVVGFDMPAHGETKGRTTSIAEFAQVLIEVAALVGPVHAVIGHSLGATALSFSLSKGLSARAAVLIAPMISFDFALDKFALVLGLGEVAKDLAARATERKVGVGRAELDLLRFERPQASVMILHDRDDRRTRHEDSARLAQNWGCPFVETRGLGHGRILTDVEVHVRVREFLDSVPRADVYDLNNHVSALGFFEI